MNEQTSNEDNATSKPDWWPQDPYPTSVFTMTTSEYKAEVPDDGLRTRVSGHCFGMGWRVCEEAMYTRLSEEGIISKALGETNTNMRLQERVRALNRQLSTTLKHLENLFDEGKNFDDEYGDEIRRNIHEAHALMPGETTEKTS